jgi:hypothetical protein
MSFGFGGKNSMPRQTFVKKNPWLLWLGWEGCLEELEYQLLVQLCERKRTFLPSA